jgi:hypothetical protein
VDVLSSHIAFTFHDATRPYLGRAWVNPTDYSSAVQREELVGRLRVVWFVGCWLLARVVHD